MDVFFFLRLGKTRELYSVRVRVSVSQYLLVSPGSGMLPEAQPSLEKNRVNLKEAQPSCHTSACEDACAAAVCLVSFINGSPAPKSLERYAFDKSPNCRAFLKAAAVIVQASSLLYATTSHLSFFFEVSLHKHGQGGGETIQSDSAANGSRCFRVEAFSEETGHLSV